MKRLITALLLFPLLAAGQTKFGQLPLATPDSNTCVIGLKKTGAVYTDYLFGAAPLMSYINSGIRGGTLQSVTDTGNTTTNAIQIGKAASLSPYQAIVLSTLATDSSGIISVKDTTASNSILLTTSDSACIQMASVAGSPITLSTNSGLHLGSGLPVTLTNGTYTDTVKCNVLSANITDTFPATAGTLALSGQVADTSSVLRGLINSAAVQSLQSVTNNGDTTSNSLYVANSAGTTMGGILNVGEMFLSSVDSSQKVIIFPGSFGSPGIIEFIGGAYASQLKYTPSSTSPGYNWTLPSLTGTIALTSQLTNGTVTSITAGTGLSGGAITGSGTISLPNTGTAGTYGSATQIPSITTDAQGRVTGVTTYTFSSGGSGTVTSITAGTGLSGGTITGSGTISLPNTGAAGTYGSATLIPSITTDAQGRVTGVTTNSVTATTPTLQQVVTAGDSYTVGSGTVNFGSGGIQFLNSSGNNTVIAPTYMEIINNSGANSITLQPATTCTVNSTLSYPVNTSGTFALTSQLGNIPHIIGQTAAPTIAAGTGAGTSPAISITGTDLSGYITLTTGSSPADSAILATVTFNTAYSSAPGYVAISPANLRALGVTASAIYSPVPGDTNGATTTTFTVMVETALTAATTYKFRYSVSQ